MSVSNEIITVLDDLCRRFGVVVDWSQENVMPYLDDLFARFISYEIATSIVYVGVALLVSCFFAACGVYARRASLKSGRCKDEWNFAACAMWVIGVIVFIITIGEQAYNIVTAMTLPEKLIVTLIRNLTA